MNGYKCLKKSLYFQFLDFQLQNTLRAGQFHFLSCDGVPVSPDEETRTGMSESLLCDFILIEQFKPKPVEDVMKRRPETPIVNYKSKGQR